MNVVMLQGTLSRAPEERHLASGDRVVGYEVSVPSPEGRAESVPVVWFDPPAAGSKLEAGSEVVVTGRVRRRFFRVGGATQSRTEVVASVVVNRRSRRAKEAVNHAIDAVERLGAP